MSCQKTPSVSYVRNRPARQDMQVAKLTEDLSIPGNMGREDNVRSWNTTLYSSPRLNISILDYRRQREPVKKWRLFHILILYL